MRHAVGAIAVKTHKSGKRWRVAACSRCKKYQGKSASRGGSNLGLILSRDRRKTGEGAVTTAEKKRGCWQWG